MAHPPPAATCHDLNLPGVTELIDELGADVIGGGPAMGHGGCWGLNRGRKGYIEEVWMR